MLHKPGASDTQAWGVDERVRAAVWMMDHTKAMTMCTRQHCRLNRVQEAKRPRARRSTQLARTSVSFPLRHLQPSLLFLSPPLASSCRRALVVAQHRHPLRPWPVSAVQRSGSIVPHQLLIKTLKSTRKAPSPATPCIHLSDHCCFGSLYARRKISSGGFLCGSGGSSGCGGRVQVGEDSMSSMGPGIQPCRHGCAAAICRARMRLSRCRRRGYITCKSPADMECLLCLV